MTTDKPEKDKLIEKLDNKRAIIGIVGIGYVGLPLMIRYAEVGFKVIAFDIDTGRLTACMPERAISSISLQKKLFRL